MTSAIQLDNITKRYGAVTAVDRLQLDIAQGELFVFLGPNGAGKTTTIKMIAGLLLPDSGTITVCGHPLGRDGRLAKSQLAYVPDEPFLYDKLSGREFLDFVAQMYGLTPNLQRARLHQLTDRLEIGGWLDQLCESYSHGMKQRIVLAAALLHDPHVLVTDEPMVGLDPKTVRTVKDLMKEMTRSGRTVFMSTHTLEVAQALADRIGIIHRGQLVAIGRLDELRNQTVRNDSLEDIFLRLTTEKDDATAETIPT